MASAATASAAAATAATEQKKKKQKQQQQQEEEEQQQSASKEGKKQPNTPEKKTMPMRKPPMVKSIEWGVVKVTSGDGTVSTYKDVVLTPHGSSAWDWRITKMKHAPGVQVADVAPLLLQGATTHVVLSRGMRRVLQVPAATVAYLEARNVVVHVLQSEAAVAKYNELCAASDSNVVCALIHSTC
jgi:hypothetical protein